MAGVANEKASLIRALPETGLAILNGDDAHCAEMAAETAARVLEVRVDSEADLFATDVRFCGLGTTFLLMGETPVTLPRLGSHNVHNALFTIAAAEALGLDRAQVLLALCDLPNSSRRLECKQLRGITFVDDTYNSNPSSARVALQALAGIRVAGRRIVLFGEMLELGDQSKSLHERLGEEVAAARDTGADTGAGAEADTRAGTEAERFTESTPLAPRSPYSATKASGDLLALAYHRTHGLDVARHRIRCLRLVRRPRARTSNT